VTDRLQPTPLAERHAAAGAKLAPFAGWSMPLSYAGTLVEHRVVRDAVGVFDVSHLGTVWIEGDAALATVAAVFTNDPARLDDGGSQYTLCCDERGGIVDDLIVYRLAADRFVAVPNAANTAEVVRVLAEAGQLAGAHVDDASTDWAILAIQGPEALALADRVVASLGADRAVSDVDHLEVAEVELAGESALLCRTGYTGEPGCELVLPGEVAGRVWDLAVTDGAQPCGLGARDTLRLEMGYPLHGNDLSVDTTPYEARLGWAVKLDRDAFRGQEALRRAKEAGPSRRLWGVVSDGRRPLRAGFDVQAEGRTVGTTTSGGFSPTLERGIALAYLDRDVEPGARVEVDVRGTTVGGEVVKPPFVARDPRGGVARPAPSAP
jgi:aminomethyltransferase